MARGIVVVTPAKQMAKAAELLGLDVKQLYTVLTVGAEAVSNDAEIKEEFGAAFVREIDAWDFLEKFKASK